MHRSEPLIGHSVNPEGHHSLHFLLRVVDISQLFLNLGYQHFSYLLLIVYACPVQHYQVRPLDNSVHPDGYLLPCCFHPKDVKESDVNLQYISAVSYTHLTLPTILLV